MAINSANIIPAFCKNCTHRFVCGIQGIVREQDADVAKFNSDNVGTKQKVTTNNYYCGYKTVDNTVQ